MLQTSVANLTPPQKVTPPGESRHARVLYRNITVDGSSLPENMVPTYGCKFRRLVLNHSALPKDHAEICDADAIDLFGRRPVGVVR